METRKDHTTENWRVGGEQGGDGGAGVLVTGTS